jgi:hypothetical protein
MLKTKHIRILFVLGFLCFALGIILKDVISWQGKASHLMTGFLIGFGSTLAIGPVIANRLKRQHKQV